MSCPVCNASDHKYIASKDSYNIHRCEACSLVFIYPFPSDAELSEFYENYHKTSQYKDKIDSKVRRATKRIRSLSRAKNLTFLDVGCNLGFATEAARRLGHEAMGIDIDSDAISRAKGLFPEANFEYAPISQLAEGSKKFDLIYCSEVIEHLTNPIEFLKDIRAVMNDGATLFLTTPDIGHYSLPKKMEELVKWTTFRPPEHLLYFDKKSLSSAFKKAGFSKVKVRLNFKPTLKIVAQK